MAGRFLAYFGRKKSIRGHSTQVLLLLMRWYPFNGGEGTHPGPVNLVAPALGKIQISWQLFLSTRPRTFLSFSSFNIVLITSASDVLCNWETRLWGCEDHHVWGQILSLFKQEVTFTETWKLSWELSTLSGRGPCHSRTLLSSYLWLPILAFFLKPIRSWPLGIFMFFFLSLGSFLIGGLVLKTVLSFFLFFPCSSRPATEAPVWLFIGLCR